MELEELLLRNRIESLMKRKKPSYNIIRKLERHLRKITEQND